MCNFVTFFISQVSNAGRDGRDMQLCEEEVRSFYKISDIKGTINTSKMWI